nr:MBL fold metallo-hydrolase [Natrinema sp. DC36]
MSPLNERVRISVQEITDGIHAIEFDHIRVFALEDRPDDTVTLVDAAFPDDGEELAEIVESEFGGLNRVIITHGDEGHFGGVPALLDRFEPELSVPAGAEHFYEALDVDPDVEFGDEDRLDGNIRAIEIPGHTVATTALLLEDDETVIAGDALEGSDRRGLPPGYLVPPAEQFNDDSHAAAERNLVKLFDYDIDAILVHHGTSVHEDPLGKLTDWLLDREWTLAYD